MISLVRIIQYLNSFFADLLKLLESNQYWLIKNIRLLYYLRIKYPILRYIMSRIVLKKSTKATTNSGEFMNFLSELIVAIESLTMSGQYRDANEFIQSRYLYLHNSSKIPIKVYSVKKGQDYIESCKLVYHSISKYKVFTDQLVHIEIEFDFTKIQCDINISIYDDEEMQKLRMTKRLIIISDGSLYNEVYKLDKDILVEDRVMLSKISLLVLAPFVYVIMSVCSYQFEYIK